MLPREHRLHADRDWDALFDHGLSVSGPVLSFRVRSTPGARRVGYSVGRKVGGAVRRNLVKRRLRGITRTHWDALPEADLGVLARPVAGTLGYAALEAAFLELCARVTRRLAPPSPAPPTAARQETAPGRSR